MISTPYNANTPNGLCPGQNGYNSTTVINAFLSQQNCINYTNTTSMPEYFAVALNSTTSSINNTRYTGTDMYAWRISAYPDLNAGVDYYNVYGDPSYKISTQIFPADISQQAWMTFINWQESND